MDINKKIASELEVRVEQVEAAVKLLDEGCTVPFISRYRKEATGSLNDEQMRKLSERLEYLRGLDERRETILKSIDEQGKLTKELKIQIEAAETMVALEDIYRPYKPKKKTRGVLAKEKGLEPFAKKIMEEDIKQKIETVAKKYIDEEKGVNTVEDAIQGAIDIIAEEISDVADYRTHIREYTLNNGIVKSEAKDKEAKSVYEMYYDFSEAVSKIVGHRILALNRGEKDKFLKVWIEINIEEMYQYLISQIIKKDNENTTPTLKTAIKDSFDRLIWPSIENEVRNILTDKAEDGAIDVFGKNVAQLLMQAPVMGKTVLGWDPAFRTGCKLAVVDPTGKVLATTVIYPTEPTTEEKCEKARQILTKLINDYNIEIISVGNGTASRESELFIVDFFKKNKIKNVAYTFVNEAGASVYSASKLATEEFPKFDVGQRSATSIARRLQDPLAELVKIEPKAIGVGQYQHDMNQKKLTESLNGVVEDCVNKVGVDLNTASYSLLSYISGINIGIAKNIVDYREKNGRFNNREELLNVPKLGGKAYEQCAGFLRIRGGDNPLDNTSVHPESYVATEKLLKELKFSKDDLRNGVFKGISMMITDYEKTANSLKIGVETLKDIVKELEKPQRDIREDSPAPILRKDVLTLEDLKEGMLLKGTIRNITDFGAFTDIGVHQDGLIHISEMSDKYIKHPLEVVKVGDIVDVMVMAVDIEKKRISLTMKGITGEGKKGETITKVQSIEPKKIVNNENENNEKKEEKTNKRIDKLTSHIDISGIDITKLSIETVEKPKNIKIKIASKEEKEEKEKIEEEKSKKTTTKKIDKKTDKKKDEKKVIVKKTVAKKLSPEKNAAEKKKPTKTSATKVAKVKTTKTTKEAKSSKAKPVKETKTTKAAKSTKTTKK